MQRVYCTDPEFVEARQGLPVVLLAAYPLQYMRQLLVNGPRQPGRGRDGRRVASYGLQERRPV